MVFCTLGTAAALHHPTDALAHFETEKGQGVFDGYEDFYSLELVDGREQEFIDRWGQILDAPPEKVLVHRFHWNCLRSTMMAE